MSINYCYIIQVIKNIQLHTSFYGYLVIKIKYFEFIKIFLKLKKLFKRKPFYYENILNTFN